MLTKNRVTVHRQQIKHPELKQIQISHHLEICGNKKKLIFHVTPLFKNKGGK